MGEKHTQNVQGRNNSLVCSVSTYSYVMTILSSNSGSRTFPRSRPFLSLPLHFRSSLYCSNNKGKIPQNNKIVKKKPDLILSTVHCVQYIHSRQNTSIYLDPSIASANIVCSHHAMKNTNLFCNLQYIATAHCFL